MKRYELYHLCEEDKKIADLQRAFAGSLKYLFELNGRKRNKTTSPRDPFAYYNEYIVRYNDVSSVFAMHRLDFAPDVFLEALMTKDELVNYIDDMVEEFLYVVARYLSHQQKKSVEVLFLPFYGESSYEQKFYIDDTKKRYPQYLRDLTSVDKYTMEEIRGMWLSAKWEIKE